MLAEHMAPHDTTRQEKGCAGLAQLESSTGEVNAHKLRAQVQRVELSAGSAVLGCNLCPRVCLSSDRREHARRRVNHMACKSQSKVFE